MAERTSYTPGTFCWVDLVAGDQAAAKAFYAALLGWEYDDTPLDGGQSYSLARRDGRAVAAIVPLRDPAVPPHWNCYVSVDGRRRRGRTRRGARRDRGPACRRRRRLGPDGGLPGSTGRAAQRLAAGPPLRRRNW
jgi:hypothetical protein